MPEYQVNADLLPGEEEIRTFQERGWYISPPLFSEEEIARVVEETDRFYGGHLDRSLVPPSMKDAGVTHHFPDPGIRKSDYASFYVPSLYQLVRSPILGAIASKLGNTPSIRLWHDQLLWKDPQSPGMKANVGWHTDRGYWQSCSSENMITAWIPFHNCNEKTGTITMMDGSHLWPSENDSALNFFENDLSSLENKMVTNGNPVKKVPMNLNLGQVSFHHCRTIHGSGPNLGSFPRRSIAVHLQDEGNTYRHHVFPKTGRAAQHNNDSICRKGKNEQPDYSDPLICPTLFRKQS